MRLVCLSDTHNRHDRLEVPGGDVLIHAGDFTGRGSVPEVEAFARFLEGLPHPDKVVIAGNHDFLFEDDPERARELLGDVTYLEDQGATVQGLEIWGSPWQPWFGDWAFNLPRGEALAAKWALVPETTRVLVTHGPPAGILDRTVTGEPVGCADLARELERIRPALHVFGHIHEAYGALRQGERLSVNASSCDVRYRAVQPPVVVERVEGGFEVVRTGRAG